MKFSPVFVGTVYRHGVV